MTEQWPNDPRTERDDLLRALEDQRSVVVLYPDGGWSVRPLTLAEGEAKVYIGKPGEDGWELVGEVVS